MKPLGLGIIGLHHQHPRWYHPLWSHLPQYKPLAVADADEAFLKAENDEFFHLDTYGDYLYATDRDLRRIAKIRMDYRETKEAVIP